MSRLSRRALLASLGAAAISTPAWASKPDPVMAPRPPGPDEALFYVFRPWAFALGGRAVLIRFNGVKAIKLATEQYSWIYLKAGDYQAALTGDLELGLLSPPRGGAITLEGGRTYFNRIVLYGTARAIVGQVEPVTEEEAVPFIRGDFKRGQEGYKLKPPLKEVAELGATDR